MVLLLLACAADEPSTSMPLRWVPADGRQTWEDARRGADWQLANLGALPPGDGSHLVEGASDADGVWFTLHLDRLGLPEGALAALAAVVAVARRDAEVETFGAMDVGRFFLRSLYEPAVYYRATGACSTLADWEAARFDGRDLEWFAVTQSSVAYGERRLWLTPWRGRLLEVGVAAEEGDGSLVEGTFVGAAVDVVDVLPNGQYRYASYDDDGLLVGGADPSRSLAGTPGRCMWCHEDHLDTYLVANDPVEGAIDAEAFLAWAGQVEAGQTAFQAALDTSLDTTDSAVHAHGEALTEGWLLPTPARLGREWGVGEDAVRAWLTEAGIELAVNPEYPEHGDVTTRDAADAVYRAYVDPSWAPLPTRASARDPTEADLLPVEGLGGCGD